MKNILIALFGVLLCAVLTVLYLQKDNPPSEFPQPTTMIKMGEEEANQDKRAEWLDLMHQAAPGTDWKSIELRNAKQRHKIRKAYATHLDANQRSGEEEEIIPGTLTGEWKERGSRNLAGSILATEFDTINQLIYAISAGGTLWRGELDGSNWEVVNQDLQFNGQILRFINGPNGRRLIALSGRIPHYSDDDGLTWTSSTGISFNDGWGATRDPIILNDTAQTIYLLAKPDYWSDVSFYKSSDQGQTFSSFETFNQSDMNFYALSKPHGSNDVYFLYRGDNETRLYKINQTTDELDLLNSSTDFLVGNNRTHLIGNQLDTIITFYSFNQANELFYSENFGENWYLKGELPIDPWGVGIYQSPTNPDLIITGGLNCQRSYDGGENWTLMNEWWEYYGDIDIYLHADMMNFKEFVDSNGNPFVLISNHGGLSISWDSMATTTNIGKEGLNVGQFYDVSTDPTDSRYIYGGSQDQGFQRGFTEDNDEQVNFEQVISGDYGHTVFTKNGTRLWTVYPGGWISYYDDPKEGYLAADWELNSEDESVWIPPIMPDPSPGSDAVYLAGGSSDGGPGSFIIKLQYFFGNITASQLPFDFKEETTGEVSALASSSITNNKWYAATTNGRFFSSTDSGNNWEQTLDFIPGGHYLYGSSIYPSVLHDSVVYFAGSGYSNPAVYKSTDNGATFQSMNEGMPSTLVFKITGNADESLLFAATEAGPYVYVVADEQWYDLAGMCAPTQTYWSVEFLEEEQIVRYGTYGRGIWDFQITDFQIPVATKEVIVPNDALNVFPNPSIGPTHIELENWESDKVEIKIYSYEGKLVDTYLFDVTGRDKQLINLSLDHLIKGNYIITANDGIRSRTGRIILL